MADMLMQGPLHAPSDMCICEPVQLPHIRDAALGDMLRCFTPVICEEGSPPMVPSCFSSA